VNTACENKLCTKCGATKPRADFINTKSGLRNWCFDCRKVYKDAEYRKYRDKYIARARRNYADVKANPEKMEARRVKTRIWKRANKKIVLANVRARQARLKQRTPAWANLKAMREIYVNCPEGYHVDHVVPLNGENVSGLHVEFNLQYLSAEENIKKSNKFDIPTTEHDAQSA
jgi:hypothetical protein